MARLAFPEISQVDLVAIEEIARRYYESWFSGDGDGMRSVLHEHLAKRSIVDPGRGDSPLEEDTSESMVRQTLSGEGTQDRAPFEISILDAFRNIASVKVVGGPYLDYLHVGRFGERWLIVNALWEPRTRAGKPD
jgi:hypothetical protein